MITSNVFHRVFHVRTETSTGTAFAIDHEGRQYLITAKHIAEDNESSDRIRIYHKSEWKWLGVQLIGHGAGDIDISVYAPCIQVAPTLQLEPTTTGLVVGQDLYFLGFPYGLQTDVGELNRDFPLPLVKKAILSAILPPTSGSEVLLLDGHNNKGFSGGPVVFSHFGPRPQYKVAAIVSGYQYDPEPIYHENEATPFAYRANTGIVIAYSIRHAMEIIQSNPVGAALPCPESETSESETCSQ